MLSSVLVYLLLNFLTEAQLSAQYCLWRPASHTRQQRRYISQSPEPPLAYGHLRRWPNSLKVHPQLVNTLWQLSPVFGSRVAFAEPCTPAEFCNRRCARVRVLICMRRFRLTSQQGTAPHGSFQPGVSALNRLYDGRHHITGRTCAMLCVLRDLCRNCKLED